MLLVTIFYCMPIATIKRANLFSIPCVFVFSIVVAREPMLPIADRLSVTSFLAIATSSRGAINLGFDPIKEVVSSDLPFLLNNIGEDL